MQTVDGGGVVVEEYKMLQAPQETMLFRLTSCLSNRSVKSNHEVHFDNNNFVGSCSQHCLGHCLQRGQCPPRPPSQQRQSQPLLQHLHEPSSKSTSTDVRLAVSGFSGFFRVHMLDHAGNDVDDGDFDWYYHYLNGEFHQYYHHLELDNIDVLNADVYFRFNTIPDTDQLRLQWRAGQ